MFKKKKKEEKVNEEPADEIEEDKEKKQPEPTGKFSLSEGEMALAVNALAASEEFKIYQQMVIGQQIAKIITDYNAAVKGKEKLPTEDEGLPEEE